MSDPRKGTALAPVTSIPLLRDGLHVTVLTDQDSRRTVKKVGPKRKKAKR